VPSLWFDASTEGAIDFYIDVFDGSPHKRRDSRLISVSR
jgi:predicted 3-demethylubiquinone-9 3-methyltransferase (glyoxalase superfamily)